MLNKIKELFGTNPLLPSTDIFPRIDTSRLNKQLNLEKRGKLRGKKELPSSDTSTLDSVENEIIDAVRNNRELFLRVYNEHKSVYNERQTRVTTDRTDLESSATQAPSEYIGKSQDLETNLQEVTVRLKECVNWKNNFRKEHKIDRASHHYNTSRIKWLAVGFLMVFFETILNGYLFAQKNQFGLLGGVIAALLISIANVGFSSLTGFYSRFINHINYLVKIFGTMIVLFWASVVLVFNFGVAHFRDGIEANLEWGQAATQAIERLYTNPIEIASFESWILVLIGCLISIFALLKGYYADDPYPGYGNVERELDKARNNFANKHELAIEKLQYIKDQMIEDLRNAEEKIKNDSKDLIDGLFGNTSLDSQFTLQLKHCDEVVQHLLQIYRESNKENRNTPPPQHFAIDFKFDEIELSKSNEINKEKMIKDLERIEFLVTEAVKEINNLLGKSIENFPSARKIESDISSLHDNNNNSVLTGSVGKGNGLKSWKK